MSTTTIFVVCTVVPLLLSGFLNHFAHKYWILYFPLIGIAIAVLYFGHLWIRSLVPSTNVRQDKEKIAAHISSIDELRREGRGLQDAFGHPDTDILDGQPADWLDKVQIALASISSSHAQQFDEIVKDPRRYFGQGSPTFTQDEMQRWQSEPRRPQQWPRICAVLHYLDDVRDELYNELK
jgi:hypothetical protein